MNSEQIKTLCKNSSQTYLNFLSEKPNQFAVDKIEVVRVTLEDAEQGLYMLRLASKIYELERIQFLIGNVTYDTTDRVRVLTYNAETNTLIVKPEIKLQKIFQNAIAHPEEIAVMSSLLFLVERVRDWYQTKNNNVKLPTKSSKLSPPTKSDFFNQKPTPDQEEAIKNVFTNPFSYIWGAPGTGKTQTVLAYSLIQYIKKGKKVIVTAATNNALEQILEGVLSITRKAEIEDKKIIRLGVPTSRFAKIYPDVCEEYGIMRKIGDINRQIKNITDVIESNMVSKTLDSILSKTVTIFSQLEAFKLQKVDILSDIKSVRREIENEQVAFDAALLGTNELIEHIKRNEKRAQSFLYLLKNKFLKFSVGLEEQIENQKVELKKQQKENEEQDKKIKGKLERLKTLQGSYVDFSDGIELIETLKNTTSGDNSAHEIMVEATFQNYAQVKIKLIEYLEKRKAELLNAHILATEYANVSDEEMQQKLLKLQEEKVILQSKTTDERIKNANVVALTLDKYIDKYKDAEKNKDTKFDHIFLDEAGYACLVKALTLFRDNVPVTFLGDHKQLPPVCEMNDGKINENGKKSVFVWAQSALSIENLFIKTKEEMFNDYIQNKNQDYIKIKKTDLLQTHRFGAELAKVLDEYVYKNGFTSYEKNPETKIYYIDAPHVSPDPFDIPDRLPKNNTNIYEVDKTDQKIDSFNPGFSIITPYKNQVKLLKYILPKYRDNIMTINRSQGQEWGDVILNSVVPMASMFFIDSKRSNGLNVINTAVSRAKERLIIVCDYNFWMQEQHQSQLIHGLLKIAKPFSS